MKMEQQLLFNNLCKYAAISFLSLGLWVSSSVAGSDYLLSHSVLSMLNNKDNPLNLNTNQSMAIEATSIIGLKDQIVGLKKRILKNEIGVNDFVKELDALEAEVLDRLSSIITEDQSHMMYDLLWREHGSLMLLSQPYAERNFSGFTNSAGYQDLRGQSFSELDMMEKKLASARFASKEARQTYIDETLSHIRTRIGEAIYDSSK